MPFNPGYTRTKNFAPGGSALPGDFNSIQDDLGNKIAEIMPPGMVMATARSSAPTGWLLCDGTAVSRVTYANLFAAISTTYGAGDGSTTFNLPDLRGRVPVGVDGAAARLAANDALGNASGAETHTLTTAQMPVGSPIAAGAIGAAQSAPGVGNVYPVAISWSSGIGGSHNNMQPYQVVNYLVKT